MQSGLARQLELLQASPALQEPPANCHHPNTVFPTTCLRRTIVPSVSMGSKIKNIGRQRCMLELCSLTRRLLMVSISLRCLKECMQRIRIYHPSSEW